MNRCPPAGWLLPAAVQGDGGACQAAYACLRFVAPPRGFPWPLAPCRSSAMRSASSTRVRPRFAACCMYPGNRPATASWPWLPRHVWPAPRMPAAALCQRPYPSSSPALGAPPCAEYMNLYELFHARASMHRQVWPPPLACGHRQCSAQAAVCCTAAGGGPAAAPGPITPNQARLLPLCAAPALLLLSCGEDLNTQLQTHSPCFPDPHHHPLRVPGVHPQEGQGHRVHGGGRAAGGRPGAAHHAQHPPPRRLPAAGRQPDRREGRPDRGLCCCACCCWWRCGLPAGGRHLACMAPVAVCPGLG